MHKNDQSGKNSQAVEDDTATRDVRLLCLDGEKHIVTVVNKREEAADCLRTHPPPDLILFDLEKPVILVVDDDAAVGRMLDLCLRHYGFVVRLAASGREAVQLYGEHHQSIALVLLDVQMPGMDGHATLSAIQTINPEVQCCFMSGSTGKYSAEELLALGAAYVFSKPFLSLNLLSRLLWDLAGAI